MVGVWRIFGVCGRVSLVAGVGGLVIGVFVISISSLCERSGKGVRKDGTSKNDTERQHDNSSELQ